MEKRKFTDLDGSEWVVEITTPDAKRVRKDAGVNLLDLDGDTFTKLLQDPETLVDVLWVLLLPQITERKLDENAFAKRLRGDAIDTAAAALLEAVCDFFPKRRREALRAALRKANELLDQAASHSTTLIGSDRMTQLGAAVMAKMDRDLDEAIEKLMPGKPSTNGPATSELIPTA